MDITYTQDWRERVTVARVFDDEFALILPGDLARDMNSAGVLKIYFEWKKANHVRSVS